MKTKYVITITKTILIRMVNPWNSPFFPRGRGLQPNLIKTEDDFLVHPYNFHSPAKDPSKLLANFLLDHSHSNHIMLAPRKA